MPTTTYAHFRDVPESAWRWPSFSPAEIACRGTGAIKINAARPNRLRGKRVLRRKRIAARLAVIAPNGKPRLP